MQPCCKPDGIGALGLIEPWLAPLAARLRQGYGRTGGLHREGGSRLLQPMDFVGNHIRINICLKRSFDIVV